MTIDENKLIELYSIQNLSCRQIGKYLNIPKSTIILWVKKLRLSRNKNLEIDLTNKKIGVWLVLNKSTKNGYWDCRCKCSKIVPVKSASLRYGKSKSCGCTRITNDVIPLKQIANIKGRAARRGLEYSLSNEFLLDLFEKQNRKCALSGVDIYFSKKIKDITASLDRIDSSKGYTEDNVQWIHKVINIMKNKFNEEEFIMFCNLIAQKHPVAKDHH